MKTRTAFFLSLLTIAGAVTLSAGDPGTYSFLRTDLGGRTSALGGSFVSMRDDPNVIFFNPASLGTLKRSQLSFGYTRLLLDVNAGSASYGALLNDGQAYGFGITYVDYGTMTKTDADLNQMGEFGARDLALTGSFSMPIMESVRAGASLVGIYSGIENYTSFGLAVDAGLLYEAAESNTSVGLSVLHLGTQLKTYNGTRERLPVDVKIGITHRPQHLPVFLNFNIHRLADDQQGFMEHLKSFSLGAEFVASKSLRLRFGYDNEMRRDLKMGTSLGLAGISLGAGIIIGDYEIDYGYSSYGKISGVYRISVTMQM